MSRHRDVRNMNYQDEYDGYDDVYGHSVEDNYCVSPSTAAQFTYDRGNQQSLSAFMEKHQQQQILEEEEENVSDEEQDSLSNSINHPKPVLSDLDTARLNSCLEQMHNILGESVPDHTLTDAAMKYDYNPERALDFILSQQKDAPKPQREPRGNRRSRSDSEDDTDSASAVSMASDWPFNSQSPATPPFSPSFSQLSGSPYSNSPGSFVMSHMPTGLKMSFAGGELGNPISSVPPPPGFGKKPPPLDIPLVVPPPGFSYVSEYQQCQSRTDSESSDVGMEFAGSNRNVLEPPPGYGKNVSGMSKSPERVKPTEQISKVNSGPKELETDSSHVIKIRHDAATEKKTSAADDRGITAPPEKSASQLDTLSALAQLHSSKSGKTAAPPSKASVTTEQAASPKVPVGISLSALAQEYASGKSKDQSGAGQGSHTLASLAVRHTQGIKQTEGTTTSVVEPLISGINTGDKSSKPQPISSLGDLIKREKTSGSSESTGVRNVLSQEKPKPKFVPLGDLAKQQTYETKSCGLSKTNISLAALAQSHQAGEKEKNKENVVPKSGSQKFGLGTAAVSLAALAQQHQSQSKETDSSHLSDNCGTDVKSDSTGGLTSLGSMSRLAAQHQQDVHPEEKISPTLSSSPSLFSSSPAGGAISLSALASAHESMVKNKAAASNKNKSRLASHLPQKDESKSSQTAAATESVPSLQKKPSIFANALCSKLEKSAKNNPCEKLACTNKFSYLRQLSSKEAASSDLTFVPPFDFSTPSPDDTVKKKQRAAFGGMGQSNQSSQAASSESQPPARETQQMKAKKKPDTADVPVMTASSGGARLTFAASKPAQTGFTAPGPEPTQEKPAEKGDGKDKLGAKVPSRDASPVPTSSAAENGEVQRTPKREAASRPLYIPRTPSRAKIDKHDALVEYEKRKAEGGKGLLNLVVCGHVDAGKSTLMGHLLFQLGFVNKRTMHKYETEAKKIGKASFAYAWVLDETEEERSRGVTMDVAQTRFETGTKIVTLLDAPGHKDFIPNMITGAAQADVAILVVNATRGEFETGFEAGGQTREHAMLIRSLGVSQLIVAVNKMDTVDWAQARFNEVTSKLSAFLKQAGFKPSEVTYVPCSGLSGENLAEPPAEGKLKAWYTGPTVVEQIDQFKPPERSIEKPFRLSVTDVFKGMGAGISASGTIQAGTIQVGERVVVMPQGEPAAVKSITIDDAPCQFGFAGDTVVITLTGIDATSIGVGSILCDASSPIRAASRLQARVVVFNIDVPLTKGFPVVFHYQSLSEPAHIRKLISQLHKSTGEVVKKRPRCLVKNTNAVIELELDRPVCVELYKDYKDLGRFMLRYSGKTIAAGLVTEILEKKTQRTD